MPKTLHELEAYEKLAQCVKRTFKGYEYYMIVSFAKVEDAEYQSNAFSLTSFGGESKFNIVKSVVSETIKEFGRLRKFYEIEEKQKKED